MSDENIETHNEEVAELSEQQEQDLNRLDAMSGLMDSEKYTELRENIINGKAKEEKEEEEVNDDKGEVEDEAGSKENDDEKRETSEEEEEVNDDELASQAGPSGEQGGNNPGKIIEHPLVGRQDLSNDKKYNEDDPKSIIEHVNKTLGIDDFSKLPSVTSKWRKDSEELSKVQKDHQMVESQLQSLPKQLQNAILMHTDGQNWRDAIEKFADIDYDKHINDYSKKEIVNTFNPGKFSAEDWKNYESGDEEFEHLKGRIDDAFDYAKGQFKTNKAAIEGYRADVVKRNSERQANYNASISRSEEHFKRTFPDAKESVIDGLKKAFSDGGSDPLFFNDDGSLKEDAFTKRAMAEGGLELLLTYMDFAKKSAVNEHVKKEIKDKKGGVRTSGGPGSGGKPPSSKTSDEKVQEAVGGKLGNIGSIMKPIYT